MLLLNFPFTTETLLFLYNILFWKLDRLETSHKSWLCLTRIYGRRVTPLEVQSSLTNLLARSDQRRGWGKKCRKLSDTNIYITHNLCVRRNIQNRKCNIRSLAAWSLLLFTFYRAGTKRPYSSDLCVSIYSVKTDSINGEEEISLRKPKAISTTFFFRAHLNYPNCCYLGYSRSQGALFGSCRPEIEFFSLRTKKKVHTHTHTQKERKKYKGTAYEVASSVAKFSFTCSHATDAPPKIKIRSRRPPPHRSTWLYHLLLLVCACISQRARGISRGKAIVRDWNQISLSRAAADAGAPDARRPFLLLPTSWA